MNIRVAAASDAKYIQSLLTQLGYPEFNEREVEEKIRLYRQEGYRLLVAEEEKQVVGFISLHWFELMHWKGKMGRITSFCIDEKFRSRGVGQQLLAAGEKVLFDEAAVKVEVTSNARRTQAHNFYLKAGYTEDSRRFVKYRDQSAP